MLGRAHTSQSEVFHPGGVTLKGNVTVIGKTRDRIRREREEWTLSSRTGEIKVTRNPPAGVGDSGRTSSSA